MKPCFKPFINWFGYSGRERRASLILLILMVIFISLRYTLPESRVEIDDMSALIIPAPGPKRIAENFKSGTSSTREPERGSGINRRERYSSQKEKLELNSCDSSDLEKLRGIGPVLSARIIKYRNLLGGYASVTQLREVYGLTDSTFMLISDRVIADSALVKKININSAGFSELNKHPYLDRYDVQAIMKYREINGSIEGMSVLIINKILTTEKASKISPYLLFN